MILRPTILKTYEASKKALGGRRGGGRLKLGDGRLLFVILFFPPLILSFILVKLVPSDFLPCSAFSLLHRWLKVDIRGCGGGGGEEWELLCRFPQTRFLFVVFTSLLFSTQNTTRSLAVKTFENFRIYKKVVQTKKGATPFRRHEFLSSFIGFY